MEYFDDKNINEDERRNTAFQLVSSVREAINLARNEPNPITYEKTLDMLHDLNPIIYAPVANF